MTYVVIYLKQPIFQCTGQKIAVRLSHSHSSKMTSKSSNESCCLTTETSQPKAKHASGQCTADIRRSQEATLPASKKQRSSKDDFEDDLIDVLKDLSNVAFVSALDEILGASDDQTTFCSKNNSHHTSQKNKKTKKKKKKIKKSNKTNSKVTKHNKKTPKSRLARRLFGIKEIVVNIVQYLNIKEIISLRRLNEFFNEILHFKFLCDDFIVYFEYSSKLLIDETIKYQICEKIENIVLWYFASLNRTVGQPIFEREKDNETFCKEKFDSYIKYNAYGDDDNNKKHFQSFVCGIQFCGEEEIDKCESDIFILSRLPDELSMNDISGECAVLPFCQLYQQLENIQKQVKNIENCKRKQRHVFGEIVSLINVFFCFFLMRCCFQLYLVSCIMYFCLFLSAYLYDIC